MFDFSISMIFKIVVLLDERALLVILRWFVSSPKILQLLSPAYGNILRSIPASAYRANQAVLNHLLVLVEANLNEWA